MSSAAVSVAASGRLATLNEAGVLDGSDCIVARRVSEVVGEDASGDAALALAFAVRAVRDGSTALDLTSVAALAAHDDDDDDSSDRSVTANDLVALPDPAAWLEAVRASPFVAQGVLRVDFDLVYLDRYFADEQLIAHRLHVRRTTAQLAPVDPSAVERVIADNNDEAQRDAVRQAVSASTTILTGGPGMGKTHTIASVIGAVVAGTNGTLRIGLAAPTGKAAARMNEVLSAVIGESDAVSMAVTLHRLLGSKPGTQQRFRHNARNPLPYDVVIVDEASMLSLSMTARLVEALPTNARLLLVGDPNQLASVEAGSVLADLVAGLDPYDGVARLTTEHRLQDDRAELAKAFRDADPDAVLALMSSTGRGVEFVEKAAPTLDDVPGALQHALRLRELALAGDAEAAIQHAAQFRLLCAHRSGPFGTRRWNHLVERALAEHAPEVSVHPMYVGRPILVTRNDYGLGISNGDTGVIVQGADGPVAVIETGTGLMRFAPWRLADIETMHAMTVHKAQGSQAQQIVTIVPPLDSRLLTRELLYTAVTRAQEQLTIVGTRDAIEAAVQSPARRSSGLAARLHRASD